MRRLSLLAALCAGLCALPAAAAARTLVVPTAFPTIQSAVNAANAGDKIDVRRGTYVEQVSIAKPLEIAGAGSDKTIIKAPATLAAGQDGDTSIVEISGGAQVAVSKLAVSGPGSGTCDNGVLGSGIRVLGGAHLDLSAASIANIHDTPIAQCFHENTGIFVGDFPVGTGSATIRHSSLSDYGGAGIVILNEGSTAQIDHNIVTGPAPATNVSTDGIEFVLGATGTVSHNLVSANECAPGDPDCGPDFFSQFQHAGITGGPGLKIDHNRIFGNQVGVYAAEAAELSHNELLNNSYFGLALQDGSLTSSHDQILGGLGGVAVIAASADTTATLDHINISKNSGPAVQKFECCGFTATTIGGP
jgi:nitrous oxidase accessory protein NosD